MVKRKNKNLFRRWEKQNFYEKSQDATLPTWRFRQSMFHVAFKRPTPKRSCVRNHIQGWSFVFCKRLGCESFQASDVWLDRWKKRYNVPFKTISGILSFDHILIFTYFWKVPYLKYLRNHFVHEVIISMELSLSHSLILILTLNSHSII